MFVRQKSRQGTVVPSYTLLELQGYLYCKGLGPKMEGGKGCIYGPTYCKSFHLFLRLSLLLQRGSINFPFLSVLAVRSTATLCILDLVLYRRPLAEIRILSRSSRVIYNSYGDEIK
jgi:hypothetical protein